MRWSFCLTLSKYMFCLSDFSVTSSQVISNQAPSMSYPPKSINIDVPLPSWSMLLSELLISYHLDCLSSPPSFSQGNPWDDVLSAPRQQAPVWEVPETGRLKVGSHVEEQSPPPRLKFLQICVLSPKAQHDWEVIEQLLRSTSHPPPTH